MKRYTCKRAVFAVLFVFGISAAFDINSYKSFLSQNDNLTTAQLIDQCKPDDKYYSSIGFQSDNYKYLDSIKLKYELTDGELSLLAKNNFVVSERMSFPTYVDAFLDIFKKDMPVFLSSDAVLYTMHKSYDDILIEIEQNIFQPAFDTIISEMRKTLPVITSKYQNSNIAQNLADIDLYLTVAASLAKGEMVEPTLASVSEVKKVLDAIASEKFVEMPLFSDQIRMFDFSQFTVRGHYVKYKLGNYFKTLMWLGRTEFVMASAKKEGPTPAEKKDLKRMSIDALLLNEVLKESGVKTKLAQIDSLLSFMISQSDNLTPDELHNLTLSSKITSPDILLADSSYDKFARILSSAPEASQQILSQCILDTDINADSVRYPVSFLLMGQRFLVDSYIFGNVIYNKIKSKRMMPDPLDVMYALGNNDAAPLLKSELTTYNYAPNLRKMRYLVDSYEKEFWEGSLYNCWLDAIRSLNPSRYPPYNKQPLFMRSAAWHQEKLNTQLFSWAQLRHDNLLYGKQSYTPIATCSYPHGYVEPYPELYKKISTFADKASSLFSSVAGGSRYASFYKNVGNLMDTLTMLSEKELNGTPFSSKDSLFMSQMIAIPALNGCGGPAATGWFTSLVYDVYTITSRDFTIADVHTQPTDEAGNIVGQILHVAVGEVNLGVFLAASPSLQNKPMAYIGPVSSYYQNNTKDFERLTDEKWESIVKQQIAIPSRPDWVNSYLANRKGSEYDYGRVLEGVQYLPSAVLNKGIKNNSSFNIKTMKSGRSVMLTLDKSSDIQISLFDIRGRAVIEPISRKFTEGTHLLSLPVASGLYTMRVKCNNSHYIIPITSIK